jgi:hypothetical protein
MDTKTVAANGTGEIDDTEACQLNVDELTIQNFGMMRNSATFSRQ